MIIALDCEMTAPRNGQICQLAYLVFDGGIVTGHNAYFAVDGMTPRAERVHHLSVGTLDALSGGRRFADAAKELNDALSRADLLAAHAAEADIGCLRAEFARSGIAFDPKAVFCTRDRYVADRREKDGLRVPWPSLLKVLSYYSLGREEVTERARAWFGCETAPHDARWDAAAVLMIVGAALT